MQRLTIIRGLPGSGKSKMAHEVYRRRNYWMVEHDHFFKDNEERKARYDAARKRESLDWVMEQVRRGIDDGRNVVVTGVFNRRRDVDAIIKLSELRPEGIEVIVATGGTGPNGKYTTTAVHTLSRDWDEVPNERIMQLDPAQGARFDGPRRLIKATLPEPTPEPEEVITATPPKRFRPSMIKNITPRERDMLDGK